MIETLDSSHPNPACFTKNLTGYWLMALPGLPNGDFQETIILVCQHNDQGAMGVVINHPITGIHMSDPGHAILDTDHHDSSEKIPIFWGGTTNVSQGFMLHSSEISWPHTVSITADVSITPHWDIMENAQTDLMDIAWPQKFRMILGHVAWSPGQLEREWMQQEWLLLPYQENFLFDIDPKQQWEFMMTSCGINALKLSPYQTKG